MTNPIVREVTLDGETIDREMTDGEYADFIATKKQSEEYEKQDALKLAKKAELLEKLGITEDEAKLLLA